LDPLIRQLGGIPGAPPPGPEGAQHDHEVEEIVPEVTLTKIRHPRRPPRGRAGPTKQKVRTGEVAVYEPEDPAPVPQALEVLEDASRGVLEDGHLPRRVERPALLPQRGRRPEGPAPKGQPPKDQLRGQRGGAEASGSRWARARAPSGRSRTPGPRASGAAPRSSPEGEAPAPCDTWDSNAYDLSNLRGHPVRLQYESPPGAGFDQKDPA
jgi:hypothetical protein